jgi:hypothetical protein
LGCGSQTILKLTIGCVEIIDFGSKFCRMQTRILELHFKVLASIGFLKKFDLLFRQKAVRGRKFSFELSEGTIRLGLSFRTQTTLLVFGAEKQRLQYVRGTTHWLKICGEL